MFDDLKQYSTEKSIISERYLLDKLNEKNITIISKDIKYNNLRINDKLNNKLNNRFKNRLYNRFKNRPNNRLYNRLNNRLKK